jgi:tripartite-type tricarboxylate transporter receptor subunit TctC
MTQLHGRFGVAQALLSGLLLFGAAGTPAAAQDAATYPNKPIRVVVPNAPGGASDFAIRGIQQSLSQALGQQVVIDNRGGASGNLGMEIAARQPPDGYTLFFGNVGTVAINPHVFKDMTVVPERDFIPISLASETPGILVASTKFPPNSVKEMIDYVKANPGKVNYASSGIATLNTLEMENFRRATGLDMTQVPYKGGAGPAIVDLIAGNVDVMFVTLSSAAEFVKGGKLKGLAVTTEKRMSLLPDVPSMGELGRPDNISTSWQGLFAPAGTPAAIVARLNAEIAQFLQQPGIQQRLSGLGLAITGANTPATTEAFIRREQAEWRAIAQELDLRPE